MAREKQILLIKMMIERNDIALFRDIFEYFPITAIVALLKTNHATISGYISNVSLLRVGHVQKMAEYFGVDYMTFSRLIANQLATDKRKTATKARKK